MNIDKIFIKKQFQTQQEVFGFLGEVMKELGVVSQSEAYVQALVNREEQSTTGLVDGFAIPHGKSKKIKEAAIVYIRNDLGIEWNSLDGSLITDIFALAIPEESDASHLNSLIAISTQLMDPKICKKLRETQNEKEITQIFE